MKKYFILLFVFILFFYSKTYASDNCEINTQTLKLTKNQKVKIEQIEQKYDKELVLFDAQITLKKMQYKQINKSNKYQNDPEINRLINQRASVYNKKNKEKISVLNIFQKRKFKKCID